MEPKERIIFALDVESAREASELCSLLEGRVGVFKIGLELFCAEGPAVVRAVKEKTGAAIFLDLKFHDIPATVAGACRSAARLGVDFVTVHCGGGARMLRAAAEAAPRLKVLGVTVLTSLGRGDMEAVGVDTARFASPAELAVERAAMAVEAGCAGVVCSGREAAAVRKRIGAGPLIVTPGVRPSGHAAGSDDQKRTTTPADAFRDGADYIVVGRPIRNAADPAAAADAIAAEIGRALSVTP
ncbi:MAG TPA: orotidine-5'-phosphate decarboxylase [Deltaproteobacteria bacterium]|nr:orotidine-5'-phosphate decarboxylase [Deltaproteobacteria bacterium]